MLPAPIIHINGWAGTGKQTIATELATLMDARLLDNHSLLNTALALFDRGTPENRALRQDIRDLAFAAAARLPTDTTLILTDAFSDDPYEVGMFDDVQRLATARACPLIRVILDIEENENLRRLTNPARTGRRKLMDPDILRDARQTCRLLGDDDADVIRLDVTALSPLQAAKAMQSLVSQRKTASRGP